MKVIDHEPHSWFLLEESGALFLDGNYSYSFTGYDWMIRLSGSEIEEYRRRGRTFIIGLAEDIQNCVPVATGSRCVYVNRRVLPALSRRAFDAIKQWKEERGR